MTFWLQPKPRTRKDKIVVSWNPAKTFNWRKLFKFRSVNNNRQVDVQESFEISKSISVMNSNNEPTPFSLLYNLVG